MIDILVFLLWLFLSFPNGLDKGVIFELNSAASVVLLVFTFILCGLILGRIGIQEIPHSRGWSIYFFVGGIIFAGTIIAIPSIVGGVKALKENKQLEIK